MKKKPLNYLSTKERAAFLALFSGFDNITFEISFEKANTRLKLAGFPCKKSAAATLSSLFRKKLIKKCLGWKTDKDRATNLKYIHFDRYSLTPLGLKYLTYHRDILALNIKSYNFSRVRGQWEYDADLYKRHHNGKDHGFGKLYIKKDQYPVSKGHARDIMKVTMHNGLTEVDVPIMITEVTMTGRHMLSGLMPDYENGGPVVEIVRDFAGRMYYHLHFAGIHSTTNIDRAPNWGRPSTATRTKNTVLALLKLGLIVAGATGIIYLSLF